jgi:hypothetical protein
MYVCEPARVGACLFAEGGFCIFSLFAHVCMRACPVRGTYVWRRRVSYSFFSLFRIAFCGPIDCVPAVRGRIGCISCQVTFQECFVIALTYHCLCLGDRRGRFERSYRYSSYEGRCTYIHHLFQRMLLTCGVWSAYGSLIACASWIERLYLWEAWVSSLTVFLFLFLSGILGMVARLSGWQRVRAALYACIHRGPSGRCLVRIASMES